MQFSRLRNGFRSCSQEVVRKRSRPTAMVVTSLAVFALAAASCSGSDKSAAATTTAGFDQNFMAAETEAALPESSAKKVTVAEAAPSDGRAASDVALGSEGLGPVPSDRKIIATADLSIRAKDVAAAAARVRSLVLGVRGYVETEQSNATPTVDDAGRSTSVQSTVTMRLRIPTASFDSVIKQLSSVGVVVSRSLGAQDVTSEVVDVNSRVISAKASIARMQVLYEKAQSIADIASIEGELSRRQADLESLLARQKELANLTSLATVSVNIFSGDAPVAISKPSAVRDAFDEAVRALGNGAKAILVVGAAILPFALLALLLWFPILAVLRSRRRRLPASPSPAAPAPSATDA